MSTELESEAERYHRISRSYEQKAREADNSADKNMYSCLAQSYTRLAEAYDEETSPDAQAGF